MNDDYDFGSNFDLGSFDDLAAVDLGNLSNFDFGSNFDLGSFEDLAAADLGNIDFGSNFDLGSFEDLLAADLAGLEGLDFGSNFDLGSFEDIAAADLAGTDLGSNFDLGSFEDLEAVDLGNRLADFSQHNQNFGSSVDMDKSMSDFDTNLTDIMQNRGGFTSQWQDVDGRKVQVYDDGTGMAINPSTGASRNLTEAEVLSLVKGGKLNTVGSGYVAATGGTGVVPGGGQTFYNSDGTRTVVTTDGKVLTVNGDGRVVDTTKRVDVNDSGSVSSTCPSPEMLILLSSGEQKKAGNLQVGDEVKTQHEKTMEWGNFKVTHAEIIPNAKRLSIKLDGKDFICSVDHKFYKDQLWVDAKDIKVGDVLSDKIVTEISEHSTGDVVQITVDDAHTYICEGVLSHNKSRVPPTTTTTTTTTPRTTTTPTSTTKNQAGLGALLPLLLALLAMNRGGGGGGSQGAVIPGLTATQRQTPYAQQQRAPGYRPGQGGVNYFEQTQFAPRMAAGGGIAGLLQGPGDGVSDSIPAVIDGGMAGGGQPAQVARGEYIMDARTVAALGNGSTDAGAERLDKMRENILRDDKKTGVGEDSKAYRHLMA
jgi:hypothetical protein